MKKQLIIILAAALFGAFTLTSCDKDDDNDDGDNDGGGELEIGELEIGDSYQGGIIFYLDGNGGGLIAAPTDLLDIEYSMYSAFVEWGCVGIIISGADGTAVGTGWQNTIDIVNTNCETENSQLNNNPAYAPAADRCANLTLGGYSDWFLPSKDELNLMWLRLADSDGDGVNEGLSDPNNLGGFQVGVFQGNYWSSSEFDSYSAWIQSYANGNQYVISKINPVNVRAIRTF
jgi:hypothetical protein